MKNGSKNKSVVIIFLFSVTQFLFIHIYIKRVNFDLMYCI